ncbi:MAG: ribosome biogenesis GTPase Der [Holosporales bacterium]|nr:ribosome biogenesis GTPase Der [Holosporales bacterium]
MLLGNASPSPLESHAKDSHSRGNVELDVRSDDAVQPKGGCAKPDATIAIVGFPNVGKSTLFNRLVGKKKAIVLDTPGVTRDCNRAKIQLAGYAVEISDTPGITAKYDKRRKDEARLSIEKAMLDKVFETVSAADLLIFVFDGLQQFIHEHAAFFNKIRKSGKPIIAAVNKCESLQRIRCKEDIYSLGIQPLFISAEHGDGIHELIDEIVRIVDASAAAVPLDRHRASLPTSKEHEAFEKLAELAEHEEEWLDAVADLDREARRAKKRDNKNQVINLAIIGRPNVGKSTLINALLGREAQIVSDIPGVTRDSVDFDWQYNSSLFKLSDTAGIRRRAKIKDFLEKIAVTRAMETINFAHVCVLVVDVVDLEKTDYGELLKQDMTLVNKTLDEGRCVVIALNKMDCVSNVNSLVAKVDGAIRNMIGHVPGLPIVPISAATQTGIGEMLDAVVALERAWNKRLPTAPLNLWLREFIEKNPPPASSMYRSKLKYMTQIKTRPPSFVIFCTRVESIPENYVRFLSKQLRLSFGLEGIPLRITLRKQDNPYIRRK